MKVSAVVVSHGNAAELAESLPALAPQVDELLVIANIPGSVPAGVEAIENDARSGSRRTSTSASRGRPARPC